MCRGLAILLDKSGKVVCKGLSSHSETAETARVEDSSLKYEAIVDDSAKSGYVVEVDDHYEKGSKQWLEAKDCLKTVEEWVSANEVEVLRSLLSCQSHAKRKGDTDNSHQETEGDTYNSCQRTEGNTYNNSQETEGDTDNSHQETEGDTYNSCQKTKGNTDNRYQKTEGNTYNNSQKTKGNTDNSYQETEGNTNNSYQETKGDTYNSSQKTEGNTDNSCQETEGNTNNSYQETKGDTYNSSQRTGKEWYCGLIELTKYPNTTAVIRQAKGSWDLTMPELIRYCAENHKAVLKQLGKEGKAGK